MNKLILGLVFFCTEPFMLKAQTTEPHRPQYHFTPAAHWMNDPNGMFYLNGTYHVFFQHFPGGTKWGPMHWGHTTSKDMIHWEEQPIALYPDSLGYIFSGSAVVDFNNTSGFGKNGKIPVVAIFTHHDIDGEQAKRNDFQNQSIAYSLDEGKTWTKYSGNPVLKNPGITDFRDPKVRWYAPAKKWIMTLATKDRITFYSSPNLKDWSKESEFGVDLGAHGGVWECPDLFELEYNGKKKWVLLVSINPGAPNGGSGTQYFIGEFDGHHFTASDTLTRWMDYGTDDYAGVTFANTGNDVILVGWMSNWLYAQDVPTERWRSALTVPRKLALKSVRDTIYLASLPVKELNSILQPASLQFKTKKIKKAYTPSLPATHKNCFRLEFETGVKDFSIVLFNKAGERFLIGYDKASNRFYTDRTVSGNTSFSKDFPARHYAPRLSSSRQIKLVLWADVASSELFADDGLTVMTDIFFPTEDYTGFTIESAEGLELKNFKYNIVFPVRK